MRNAIVIKPLKIFPDGVIDTLVTPKRKSATYLYKRESVVNLFLDDFPYDKR